MKYLLGIDVGTSGVKCIAMGEDGTVAASVTKNYPLITPRPAWSEQKPADWWEGTAAALRELTEQIDTGDIIAAGLSGQMHGLVPLDSEGSVIRNAILWNDQRTPAECAEIIESAGGLSGLVSLTNNTMLPGFTGGKLLWLKKNEPDNYDRISKFVMPKDYIRYMLTGELKTDVSDASGTGLFDVKNRRWSNEAIERAGLRRGIFPDVVESDEVSGKVTAQAAQQTGLPEGLAVYGGGGDAVIQNTGMGIVREGTLGVVLGTSGVVGTALKTFGENRDGLLQFFCNNTSGRYMAFGCQLSSAGSMEWFKNTFYKDIQSPFKEINRAAEQAGVGANGVVFLPYLTGERCPHADADARGVFFGLSLLSTLGDMARAVMEGVTFGLKQMYDLILQTNAELKITEVSLSGGGSNSELWQHIVADIFGLPAKMLTGAGEGGAYGAALVAGVGAGVYQSLDEADATVHTVVKEIQPDMENHKRYMRIMEIYDELYEDLKGTFTKAAKLSE